MIQFVEKDFEGIVTRVVSLEEDTILLVEAQKALEKNYHATKEAMLALVNAFDKSPSVPITLPNVLKTVEDHYEALGFTKKSADEKEYEVLSARLGPQATETITRNLGRYRLENTGEEFFQNFNCLAHFFLTNGWTVSADLSQAIGNIQNSRFDQYGKPLQFKPNPDERKRLAELEKKAAAQTTKVERQPQAYDDGSGHLGRPLTGELARHAEMLHRPTQQRPVQQEQNEADYWRGRVNSFISSIRSNQTKDEATALFGMQPHNGNWQVNYRELEAWHSRLRPGAK